MNKIKEKIKRSKYWAKKTIIDWIKFDSKMEADYYLYLLTKYKKSEIKLQPKFLLQSKYKNNKRKNIREINYIADFQIGNTIIDIKWFETTDFKLKKKMFEYIYNDFHLICITYVKKYWGWIELEELKKLRKANKKKG